MKLSAQEEYCLRLLVRIAKAEPGRSRTISELAQLEDLSEPHVAKLLMILRKAGFIASTRGSGGGYALAVDPAAVSVGSILAEVGGRIYDETFCARHSGLSSKCRHAGDCNLESFWREIQKAVDSVTFSRTLTDLLGPAEGPITVETARRGS